MPERTAAQVLGSASPAVPTGQASPYAALASPGSAGFGNRAFSPPPHVVGGRHVTPLPHGAVSPALPSHHAPPLIPLASPLGTRRTLPPGALSSSLGRGNIQELLRPSSGHGQPVQAQPLWGTPSVPLNVSGPSRAGTARTASLRASSARPGDATPGVPRLMGPEQNAEASSVSAPSAPATPAVPQHRVSVVPPQVSASLRQGVRTGSMSPGPQRNTLPASWGSRRGVAESPLATASRVSAVSRMYSGSSATARAGSPVGQQRVAVVSHMQDGRLRSSSPDRPYRGAVVVHRQSTSNAVRSTSTTQQEDPSRTAQDFLDADGAFSRFEIGGQQIVASPDSDPLQLEPGIEVSLGDHQLRCLNVLGSGSYSIVWRAEVIGCTNGAAEVSSSANGSRMLLEKEVALKDVLCRSNAVLRQSLFEVQLLLALERRVLLDVGPQPAYPLRLPRCFAYKVDSREEGWRVRTAMTRLPGEQLDDWLRRAAVAVTNNPEVAWTSQLQRGCRMAESLVRQIGPTLQRLAPLAWHRDVNSHNVLVSEHGTDKLLNQSPEDTGASAEFWLIDLGLAVDARSWVSSDNPQGGTWRVTDIGGDCRYWPASSWMVHLYGADFLAEREDYCRQYQWRLDSFGLGITAVELICSTALAARLAGAPPVECETIGEACWARLLDAWQRYYDRAGNWWAEIYKVFSTGGDFRPVHAWLVEEQVAHQVVALMEDLREGLRSCMACAGDEASARTLSILAELIDETSDYELQELCQMFLGEEATASTPSATVPPAAAAPMLVAPPPARQLVASPRGSDTWADAAQVPTVAASNEFPAGGHDVPVPGPAPMVAPPAVAGEVDALIFAAESVTQEDVALASMAAAEGRHALASLPPIPSIASAESSTQNVRKSRHAELAELVEAQAQLRHDLDRLQQAKLRLQQARSVHESKKQNALANAKAALIQANGVHWGNGIATEACRGRTRS